MARLDPPESWSDEEDVPLDADDAAAAADNPADPDFVPDQADELPGVSCAILHAKRIDCTPHGMSIRNIRSGGVLTRVYRPRVELAGFILNHTVR